MLRQHELAGGVAVAGTDRSPDLSVVDVDRAVERRLQHDRDRWVWRGEKIGSTAMRSDPVATHSKTVAASPNRRESCHLRRRPNIRAVRRKPVSDVVSA
jgi:hypothetical protein